MATVVHIVKKGETLSEIAKKYKTKVSTLAKKNNIKNVDLIFDGQKLTISGTTSSVNKKKSENGKKAVIEHFGLQSNSDNTIFATWKWDKSNTDKYKIKWTYATGDGISFIGSESEVSVKQATYSMPDNATSVSFTVKPISKTHKVNNKDTSYWTAEWSTKATYYDKKDPPEKPSTPDVTIENLKLTASLDNIESHTTWIKFQIVKNNKTVFKTGNVGVKTGHASFSCPVTAGGEYKVRAQGRRGDYFKSEWSDYSNNEGTPPAAPASIISLKALSETAIQIDWENVSNAESYEISYVTKTMYFDSGGEEDKRVTRDEAGHAEITGLESGQEYFFRVRAINDKGESPWTEIKSIVIGKKPAAPTTWSSTTTVITGEPLTLYWIHNTQDGSSQTYAELELYIGEAKETYTIKNTEDEEEKDKTSSRPIDTSEYVEGTKIRWRVRTKGITDTYGDWSIERTVDVYAPPTLQIKVTDINNEEIDTITSFPCWIYGLAGPDTQHPIGYHVSVISEETYPTVDRLGNENIISRGDEVYSNYCDSSDSLLVKLSADNIDLENNVTYKVKCVVTLNSGLTAEDETLFTVSWADVKYEPNAEISIDPEDLTASVRPYCHEYATVYKRVDYDSSTGIATLTDEILPAMEGETVEDVYINAEEVYIGTTEDGEDIYVTEGDEVYSGTTADGTLVYFSIIQATEPTLVANMSLSVYRREYDGSFVELGTGINNLNNTFVPDPHPALDYARYRIVAIDDATGAVSFADVSKPMNEHAVIITWNEQWRNFDTTNEDALEEPEWSGSMLKLPYNIDVSDSNSLDVSLIEYIGRSHPVSYYGTQLGIASSWSVEVPKDDKDTLYALRQLSRWMGDVYVREPSGSGYWASISVSFSQNHTAVTIPVSLSITRVEGGA